MKLYYQDLSTWPNAEWTELDDPLPVTTGGMSTACTEAVTGGEIWSTGGSYKGDMGEEYVLDTNLYYPAEPCLGSTFAFTLEPGDLASAGKPGEIVTYTLVVTNTGDLPDAYNIELSSTWSASVSGLEGALDAGQSLP